MSVSFDNLSMAIINSLSFDLLKPSEKKYQLNHRALSCTSGHCYIATEVLYHLWGKENGFYPKVLHLKDNRTHWFLCSKQSGEIVDLTASQFPEPPQYNEARWCGFMYPSPCKRSVILKIKVDKFLASCTLPIKEAVPK